MNLRLKKHIEKRIGETFTTSEGFKVEIVEYLNAKNITVLLEDGNLIYGITYNNLKKGYIKNPYKRNVFGGFMGGKSIRQKGKYETRKYAAWVNILVRCNDETHNLKFPTYEKASVCEEWENFQNFSAWYDENYVEGWQIDKDILIEGNEIYCKENCCFVPQIINLLFKKKEINPLGEGVRQEVNRYIARISKFGKRKHIGCYAILENAQNAYKEAKEAYIKELAEKYKEDLNPKVYKKLIEWKL